MADLNVQLKRLSDQINNMPKDELAAYGVIFLGAIFVLVGILVW